MTIYSVLIGRSRVNDLRAKSLPLWCHPLVMPMMAHDPVNPTKSFAEQVKAALENLYDFAYLQRHPLRVGESEGDLGGEQLRRELVAAVETLDPGADVPFRSPSARLYNLLHLRYIEGMTVQETANALGMSLRQTYRDLRRAEESAIAVLWAKHGSKAAPSPQAAELSGVQAEMQQLTTRPGPTDVRFLVQRAVQVVERMGRQRGIQLDITLPAEPVMIVCDAVIAQQILILLLSQAIQQASPQNLPVQLMHDARQVFLNLRYTPERKSALASPAMAQLIERLDWKVEEQDLPTGERELTLRVFACGPTVLVIDDNAGLVSLISRYLATQACQVIATANGREGLQVAQEVLPDAIILDVMMPEMDGWEVLQRLRMHPRTRDILVIVCSVFVDPELATSLGASRFLAKPISRDDVLRALRESGLLYACGQADFCLRRRGLFIITRFQNIYQSRQAVHHFPGR
jgi:CheY-like chemotaxis protein